MPIWLRVPVIPGLTDGEAGIAAVARLAAATPNVRRVSLLPYHRTAAGKRARLSREDPLAGVAAPPRERMEALAAVFGPLGVPTTIGG